MDAYEATRIVYQRIQNLDPENASKIMGFLLIQEDHGDREMIRLAFGPETLLHTLIITAYNELGLSATPTPDPSPPSPFHPLSRQNSSSSRLSIPSSSSWAPSSSSLDNNLMSPNSTSASYASVVATNGNGFKHPNTTSGLSNSELIDELHLQEQLSFLNEAPKNSDLFYPSQELGTSLTNDGNAMFLSNWAMNNGQHRRSLSVTDIASSGADPFGWKPCLYYARGYCKNGTSCRFLHGPPDSPDSAALVGSPSKLDLMEQCQEYLLRSKSQRLSSASHLLGSSTFPYSPTASKSMNFMLQQQQNESQRAAAAAAAGLILGGEDLHQFGRSRMERSDFSSLTGAGMVNPGSRQIYLTFPADSTFREEDVSNYFSIYGPVQDVRIPYQQKRMFGFVTFVYPETVKLILAKGNPHFVCDARVLVKPYKEKGKVPDKKQQLVERGEFSPVTTPTAHDHRDPFDLQQLGMQMQSSPRLLYNTHDLLLRRKLEEQAELQQAIELHSRKLMGLHLFEANKHHRRNLSTGASPMAVHSPTHPHPLANQSFFMPTSPPDESNPNLQEDGSASNAMTTSLAHFTDLSSKQQVDFNHKDNGKNFTQGDSNSHGSVEDNLPDSPFASPTNGGDSSSMFFTPTEGEHNISVTSAQSPSLVTSSTSSNTNDSLIASSLDMANFKSRFLQMPRLSSDNGAIPM